MTTRRKYGSVMRHVPRKSAGDAYEPQHAELIEAMLTPDGQPPCAVPDDCGVCALLTHQRPGESRQAWIDRISATARAVLGAEA